MATLNNEISLTQNLYQSFIEAKSRSGKNRPLDLLFIINYNTHCCFNYHTLIKPSIIYPIINNHPDEFHKRIH